MAEITAGRPRSICIVERGRNPSTDYYVLPRVSGQGVPVELIDATRNTAGWPRHGSQVVIVRYLDERARRRIEAARRNLAGIIYFMDDDLLDLAALRAAPLPYAARMYWLACRHRAWLRRAGARLWVSTPYLAEKYRGWDPVLAPPAPTPQLLERRSPALPPPGLPPGAPQVRVFYHGTGLHRDEIRWLEPVVREVQARSARTRFEIFGRAWVDRLYRGVPRTSVLRPMGWEDYRGYCAGQAFDVGLAPLLPHAFNAARSHTRFYDFVRCGAAGIFSNLEPYASFVRHESDGLLVENRPAAWAEAILRLAEDAGLRGRIAAQARSRAGGGR